MSDESPTLRLQQASPVVRSGIGFGTILFVLMFLTGNCDACSGTNRDYVGDAIDAMGH